jgi:stage II sporulation protein AA (anti-sigma F factor antagonist)
MNVERSQLEIDEGAEPGVLRISGDLDSHSSRELLKRIEGQERSRALTIDLSEVRFMDSSGLRVLVASHEERVGSDGPLMLRDPSDAVRRLLAITALNDYLNITSNPAT